MATYSQGRPECVSTSALPRSRQVRAHGRPTFKPSLDRTGSAVPPPPTGTPGAPRALLEPLTQAVEQRRAVARHDRMHHELVLIDQSQTRQRQREGHASHEQATARLPLELLRGVLQVPPELRVPIDPIQSARHDVLLRPVIVRAKAISESSIQSGPLPDAGSRHASTIIPSVTRPKSSPSARSRLAAQ